MPQSRPHLLNVFDTAPDGRTTILVSEEAETWIMETQPTALYRRWDTPTRLFDVTDDLIILLKLTF
jgi:hypothetical protein